MFVGAHTQFRPVHTQPVETTIFHKDGSRTVIGTLATICYAPDGTATIIAGAVPEVSDTLRWDLAA